MESATEDVRATLHNVGCYSEGSIQSDMSDLHRDLRALHNHPFVRFAAISNTKIASGYLCSCSSLDILCGG